MKLVLLTSVFVFSAAQADRRGSDARQFMPLLKDFVQSCSEQICQAPNQIKQIYSNQDNAVLVSDQLERLKAIAWEQAQVWADTILEGDFQAEGDTRLDAVYALYRNDELVAYRIVYSEKAWNTADCDFDGVRRKSIQTCPVGRIVEASYISPSLKTYVIDENQFAEFQASK